MFTREALASLNESYLTEARRYNYTSRHRWVKPKSFPYNASRVLERTDGWIVAENINGWTLYGRKGWDVIEVMRMPESTDWPKSLAIRWADDYVKYDLNEVAPPGFSGTIKAMKDRHPEIKNPYALMWAAWKRGAKSHYRPTHSRDRYVTPKTYRRRKREKSRK